MTDKVSKYVAGIGWRYDVEHTKLRRMQDHDYQGRCVYMVTLTTEDREPLLGVLRYDSGRPETAHIEPTALGQEVIRCWSEIPDHYPEVRLLAFQLMPDHVHGLLFVTREQEAHLGHMIKGFKIGCTHAFWQLQDAGLFSSSNYNSTHTTGNTPHTTANAPHTTANAPHTTASAPHTTGKRQGLFSGGYQDSILKGKDQLDRMFNYIADNPRRLAVKRQHPDLFRVVGELTVNGQTFAAIGNRWLLDRPIRMQVRCHNNQTAENLRLIERQKAYFLARGQKGGVIVSPCISAGEKEIAHAALDAHVPLVVILENGFQPMYKPPGKYFEACANGLLLMLAPWPFHMEKRTITRQQCLALNDIAYTLSTDPWTSDLENMLSRK